MEVSKMKKAILLLGILAILCTATSNAVVIYNSPSGGTAAAWNWGTNICTSAAAEVDIGGGNMVIRHTGVVNNNTTAATNARFGSKWDFTVSGNTSAKPVDYTVSFDVRNVSGNWNPIVLGVAIVTPNPAVGTAQYGHGYTNQSIAQAAGWVHVEFKMDSFVNNWWQGATWDLLQSTWSIEIGQPYPGDSFAVGTSFTQVWEMDNLKITMGSNAEAHDPVVLPANGDGSAGTLISQTQAQVTFGWNAGGDPGYLSAFRVNPAIKGHYVYLSNGNPNDPNSYLLGYVAQVHNADPNLTNPYNTYGPVAVNQATAYSWKIEEAMTDPNGNPYPAGNTNNIMGPKWTFTTIAATPTILVGPENALATVSGNASFSVTGGPAATDYRWFKVGTPAIKLSDGGIYSGTHTSTLVITGATAANEGQFYCIAYNGNPDAGGIASTPSNSAKLWYPRQVSYYPFETITDNVTPDTISGFNATMMQAGAASLPGLTSTNAKVGTSCLLLNNADAASADGQYAQIPAGVIDYKDMTISLWVHPNSIIAWTRALDFGNTTTDYMFITPDAGWGVMRFTAKADNGTEQLLESTALTASQWYHVAVTITGDTGRLYRNGELVATNTGMTINPIDVGAVLNYIGKSQYTGDPEFNGMIDDLKIWNYALNTIDVAQEYLKVVGGSVCNREIYDQQAYDTNGNCIIDLPDFASFAARWLEDDRIYVTK
jgi:hypothetical protein